MLLAKGTKVLTYNGKIKNVEDLNNDFLITPSGNIVKSGNIIQSKNNLFKFEIANGLPIIGKNIKFLTLNKFGCRHPLEELKKAKIIISNIEKGYYIIGKNIKRLGDFEIPKEWAWLLGLFASNGRIKYKNNKKTAITIFSTHKEEVKEKIKRNFVNASIIDDGKLIVLSGKKVVNFFTKHIIGSQKNRRVSADIFWMRPTLQLEFLKGWFSNKNPSNTLIGCLKAESMAYTIAFMLNRNKLPYSMSSGINFRFVISSGVANKFYGRTFTENRKIYRNFSTGILFKVKKISKLNVDAFEINVPLIANGYAIGEEVGNINITSNCCKCNKIIRFSETNVCSKCQIEELDDLSWRYELRCQTCNKIIKNKRGNKKFCSEVCRRKSYNPLENTNIASDYKGYVNKGYVSYPQDFIYRIVKTEYNKYDWTYNNRTILRNPITNYPIELDIWCEKLRFAIEFDGKQHFEDYRNKTLQYSKKMDEIKNNECEKNNIKLLRISYKDDWKNKDWIIKKVGECINDNN